MSWAIEVVRGGGVSLVAWLRRMTIARRSTVPIEGGGASSRAPSDVVLMV